MKYSFSQKMRLIKKLTEKGIKTENQIKSIQFSDVKDLKLSSKEILLLCEMQIEIKKGRLYSYLAETDEKENKEEKEV